MKRFLLGVVIGLFIGWLTVPILRAAYEVRQSDGIGKSQAKDDEEFKSSRAYKWYLQQMLLEFRQANQHLQNIEDNTKALKDKLKA